MLKTPSGNASSLVGTGRVPVPIFTTKNTPHQSEVVRSNNFPIVLINGFHFFLICVWHVPNLCIMVRHGLRTIPNPLTKYKMCFLRCLCIHVFITIAYWSTYWIAYWMWHLGLHHYSIILYYDISILLYDYNIILLYFYIIILLYHYILIIISYYIVICYIIMLL